MDTDVSAAELIKALKALIARHDESQHQITECLASHHEVTDKMFDDHQAASLALLVFWSSHRDRVKFLVWDGDADPGFDVTRGYPEDAVLVRDADGNVKATYSPDREVESGHIDANG